MKPVVPAATCLLASLLALGCATGSKFPVATAPALVETQPVATSGDAADDPAIWVHPEDPGASLVLGTDKKRGLMVYDLAGRIVQELPDGSFNNVDVRSDVRTPAGPVDLVLTENRVDNTLRLYRINRATLRLEALGQPIATGVVVYGCTLARDVRTQAVYAFVGSKEGIVEQWELVPQTDGTFAGRLARKLQHGGQVEGMVGDDENGVVFIGEELGGIWRWDINPASPTVGRIVVPMVKGTPLDRPDLEGLTIYRTSPTAGYLIASHQGRYRYLVYDRQGEHTYLGAFQIGAQADVDAVQETDGLDVTSTPLGERFPAGLLVVQDGMNPGSTQNFKYVSWKDVATGIPLP